MKCLPSELTEMEHTQHPSLSTIIRYTVALSYPTEYVAEKYGYSMRQLSNRLSNFNTGRKLWRLRRKLGMTQEQVAKQTGLQAATISHVENGNHVFLDDLLRLSACYHISLYRLVKSYPQFHMLQKHSPAMVIFSKCQEQHTSIHTLTRSLNSYYSLKLSDTLHNKIRNSDSINEALIYKLKRSLIIHVSDFQHISNHFTRIFKKYQRSSHLTENNFSYRLNVIRCKKHLSLKQLGQIIGMSASAIRFILYRPHLKPKLQQKIINALPAYATYLKD